MLIRRRSRLSAEERLQALERERDDLKKRNAELEQRLRQLQTTVDNLVHDAVGEQPAAQRPVFPPMVGMGATPEVRSVHL